MFYPHLSSPASESSHPPPSASHDTRSSARQAHHSCGPKSEKTITNQVLRFQKQSHLVDEQVQHVIFKSQIVHDEFLSLKLRVC